MKPTIHKHKNMRGRITGYSASIGAINSTVKPTPKEAVTDFEQRAVRALEYLQHYPRVFSQHGKVGIVTVSSDGFGYLIVDNLGSPSQCWHSMGATIDQAEAQARHHIAQTAWTFDVEDDYVFVAAVPERFGIRKDLLNYFAWQRDYRRLSATGLSADECHQQAQHNLDLLQRTHVCRPVQNAGYYGLALVCYICNKPLTEIV